MAKEKHRKSNTLRTKRMKAFEEKDRKRKEREFSAKKHKDNKDPLPYEEVLKYPSIKEVISEIRESTREEKYDYFIDSSFLDLSPMGFAGKESLIRKYRSIFGFMVNGKYKNCIRKLNSDMRHLVRFYNDFLARPNVFVTRGIAEEQGRLTNIFLNTARYAHSEKKIKRKYLAPIIKLQDRIDKTKEKIEERGLSEDPLADLIYNLIPETIFKFGSLSEEPSENDKRLIATSLAAGFYDGRDKVILTHDWGVINCLRYLENRLYHHPEVLRIENLGVKPEAFSAETRGIRMEDGNILLKRLSRFRGAGVARKLAL